MISLLVSFIVRPVSFKVLSSLADRDEKQNKTPIVQEETLNNLLLHPDRNGIGWEEIHLKVLKELAEMIAKPLSII